MGKTMAPDMKLAQGDLAKLKSGLLFLEAFLRLRPTMPLQHAYTIMLVAIEEGLSVSEYAERAGVGQTVMTRHLLDLGLQTRSRDPGLDLVIQRPNPLDLRKHQTFLTAKGRAMVHRALMALK